MQYELTSTDMENYTDDTWKKEGSSKSDTVSEEEGIANISRNLLHIRLGHQMKWS